MTQTTKTTKRAHPSSSAPSGSFSKSKKLKPTSNRPSYASSFHSASDASSYTGSDDEGSDEDGGSGDEESSKAAMLAALEAHSRAMLGDFGTITKDTKGKGRALDVEQDDEDEDEDEEGWSGEDDDEDDDEENDEDDDEENDEDDDEDDDEDEGGEEDDENGIEDDDERWSAGEDDELPSKVKSNPKSSSTLKKQPTEVIFDPTKYQKSTPSSRADYKAFMSSKTSKILAAPAPIQGATKTEQDVEKNHQNLDKTLQSLILTSLLPTGTSSSRTALQGRLNELAGAVKLGEGERAVRKAEVMKLGASRVGNGMRSVGRQRWEKGVAEAKERGDTTLLHTSQNAHLSASLYGPTASSSKPRKETDRGLSMGEL
ncbi:SDA1 domain [Phaffia rhodozyma]|uniref:SDA1 domain n=1 Tax=Phaffia rhodozyma TaxID=264483 RepID=A0A0F7SKN9_PHARH|nr:SDA1 domain [Phaffia rhodozyma]